MAGCSGLAGTHSFVVPDRLRAQALAEGLAAYGFALVTARPRRTAEWVVDAYDEGPYPADTVGHRTIDAVGRQAAAVAHRYGGYLEGGSRCDSRLTYAGGSDAPIVQTNPGARPPVPGVVLSTAPLAAPLVITPDSASDGVTDLTELDDIPWPRLRHALGPASNVPRLIRALAEDSDDWPQLLDELLGDNLLHQGSCYPATAPAVPFLFQLLVAGVLPAPRRLDLCVWLVIAADCWADSILADAGRAAAHKRPPEAGPWTQDVHSAIAEALPPLVARWGEEPPAVRYVLACLAALHPQTGGRITEHIGGMSVEYAGTQPGAYLELAGALLRTEEGEAVGIASEIVSWDEDLDPGWLDAPGVAPAVKAGHVLAEGVLRSASNTRVG
jgi:hypothetical protein